MSKTDNTKKKPTWTNKIKAIGLNPTDWTPEETPNKLLNALYKLKTEKKQDANISVKKPQNDNVLTENDPRYIAAINYINDLLKIIGHKKIKKLEQFQNIKRTDMMLEKCKKAVDKHSEILIDNFTKKGIHYHSRNRVKSYALTILRNIASQCGFKFISSNIQKTYKKENGGYDKENIMYYSLSK